MALVPATYSKSKTLYAFDPTEERKKIYPPTHTTDTLLQWDIRAIWTKTTKGVTTVAYGWLSETFRLASAGNHPTYQDFLAEVDMRYGGTPEVKWDGTYVHAPSMPFATIVERVEMLEEVRLAIPDLPEGFDGWYQRG